MHRAIITEGENWYWGGGMDGGPGTDELRGRVTGIVSLSSGLMPGGAFIAGFGSDFVGPQTMTPILAGITGAIAVIVFFS